ncbi:MAG TPA: hypothetical protein ENH94_02440 [Phycisphaerales bacterium]|nr:hypothetical protein [Phycisphaerales bacterium]
MFRNRVVFVSVVLLLSVLNVACGGSITPQVDTDALARLEKLWKDYDPRKAPLKTDVFEEWDTDDMHLELVLYSLGKFEGRKKASKAIAYTTTTTDMIESEETRQVYWPEMAAYYGYPKGGKNLPAILHLHGGGQRASKSYVKYWVSLGYAAMSINWGGKVIEEEFTPNTDWDGLAADGFEFDYCWWFW